MLARCALIPIRRADRGPSLGSRDEAAAFSLEPPAEDFLASPHLVRQRAHWVEIGAVDKIDARFRRLVQDRNRGGFVCLLAERRSAETQARHADSGPAELPMLHACHSEKVFPTEPDVTVGGMSAATFGAPRKLGAHSAPTCQNSHCITSTRPRTSFGTNLPTLSPR